MEESPLARALEGARADIEMGLAKAEAELRDLEIRRAALQALIARAHAALGQTDTRSQAPNAGSQRALTLHEAMVQVLQEHGGGAMSARDIADEINRRQLYRKRDG